MSKESKKRIFITSADTVTHRENNLVDLRFATGESAECLEPRRLFPVSRPEEYITLLNSEGKEAAVIRRVDDLNDSSARVIANSLNDYYLVPFITAILSIEEKNGTMSWTVMTNRGKKTFDIRNRNHDIRVHPDGSVRIRDSHDNRYVIADHRKLDKHSLRLISPDI